MSATSPTSPTPYSPGNTDLVLLIGRIALVLLFPISGYFKIMQWPGIVTLLTTQGAPLPMLGGMLAVAAETILPLLIILGLQTRWAAFGLILYTLGADAIAHRFWEFTGRARVGRDLLLLRRQHRHVRRLPDPGLDRPRPLRGAARGPDPRSGHRRRRPPPVTAGLPGSAGGGRDRRHEAVQPRRVDPAQHRDGPGLGSTQVKLPPAPREAVRGARGRPALRPVFSHHSSP